MRKTDSFTICPWQEMASVVTHSRLSGKKLSSFLNFVFEYYSPVVVICQSMESSSYAYIFAQSDKFVDVASLLKILTRWEMGWNLSDGLLYSPRPSKLEPPELQRAIASARRKVLANK
ncbi:MAG: hypothetical protein WA865_08115 [Spirulinaceae cyanobacterium]